MDAKTRLAGQFQALADPIRLRIIDIVSRGLPSATDLNQALGMSQPRVAHHLKVLVDAGLVQARRDGRFVRYLLPTDPAEAALVEAALGALDKRPGVRARREASLEPEETPAQAAAPREGARSLRPARAEPAAGAVVKVRPAEAPGQIPSAGPDVESATPGDPEPEPARPGLEDFLL